QGIPRGRNRVPALRHRRHLRQSRRVQVQRRLYVQPPGPSGLGLEGRHRATLRRGRAVPNQVVGSARRSRVLRRQERRPRLHVLGRRKLHVLMLGRIFGFASLTVLIAASAVADDGFYIGGSLGRSSVDTGTTGPVRISGGDYAYKAFAGYRFLKFFAVEAAYT